MKRFTETTKWQDPWFSELTAEQKTLWIYLCDNCDNAGVIDFSNRLAGFLVNGKESLDLNSLGDRIKKLPNGKILIPGFVPFQYGNELKIQSNLHKSVIMLMEAHELKLEYFKGSLRVPEGYLKTPSKGKGKGKGKGKDIRGFSKGDCEWEIAKKLFNEIKKIHPGFKTPNFNNWAEEIDKAIRIDKRNFEQLEYMINWVFDEEKNPDPFWRGTLQSTKKLREHFDKIAIKIKQGKQNQNSNEVNGQYQPTGAIKEMAEKVFGKGSYKNGFITAN